MTDQKLWMKVSERLYNEKIAEPVIWLGDDRHYDIARGLFGDNVYSDLIHRHRNYQLKNINYDGQIETFFESDNYKRAKDISLKMMDRLDLYGTLGRLDREVYFHNLLIFYLKKIVDSKPDVLITAENPHDYPKYIIYEICNFLDIPCYKFNNWMLSPLMFLENIKTGDLVRKNTKFSEKLDNKFFSEIKLFIENVKNSENKYELYYMRTQRINSRFFVIIKNFFRKEFIQILKDFKHNSEMYIKSIYNPINPFRLNLFTRLYIQNKRKLNLRKANLKSYDTIDLKKEFVYFPLHYEPERTTNPDGGFFHDQFIAISKLRGFVPSEIDIIIKEHPSQTYQSMRGSRGRSPLFYNLIKNIKGVKLIDVKHDSLDLIKRSLFTVTITGSVAIEASILGKKSLVFGKPWYKGCPNTFIWNENLDFKTFINKKQYGQSKILDFFIDLKDNYSVPGFINSSQRKHHKSYADTKDGSLYIGFNDFEEAQNEGVYRLLKSLFYIKTHGK